jgi:hypothetical protein
MAQPQIPKRPNARVVVRAIVVGIGAIGPAAALQALLTWLSTSQSGEAEGVHSVPTLIRQSLFAVTYGSLFALPVLVVLGVPAYRVAFRHGRATLLIALLYGAFLGLLYAALVSLGNRHRIETRDVGFFVYYGAWVAAGFWLGLGAKARDRLV